MIIQKHVELLNSICTGANQLCKEFDCLGSSGRNQRGLFQHRDIVEKIEHKRSRPECGMRLEGRVARLTTLLSLLFDKTFPCIVPSLNYLTYCTN
jgi:hypothetical protein